MKTRFFSPEERPDHDALMLEAGYDPYTGKAYPAWRIKENLGRMIDDAIRAGHRWAQYVADDALLDGLSRHWTAWNTEQKRVKARVDGREVQASGSRGSRQRDENGKVVHQRLTWIQMEWAEVFQQEEDALMRIGAERITVSIARKLAELRDRAPDSIGPADAAELLGTTVEEWLLDEAA